MKVINGKVWIENTDTITDVQELDFNIYKVIKLFLSNGATIEIGESTTDYGVGLYCTNYSQDELREIIKEDYERRNINIPMVVTNMFSYIKALGQSHREAEFQGYAYGFNTGDVLYKIRLTCKEDVIPKILGFEEADRETLISMLEGLLTESDVSTDLITRIIYFSSHPELANGKKEEKVRELA